MPLNKYCGRTGILGYLVLAYPMKNSLILLYVSGFIFQANAQVTFSKKCLSVTESSVQSWSPGNAQVGDKGGGLIYQIKAVLKKSGNLTFDSLFVDGKSFAIEVVKGSERAYMGSFKKGDSVTLLSRQNKGKRYLKSSADVNQVISSKKMFSAFISIWSGGKRYLHPVTEFKKQSRHDVNQ
jgi:hypothetical protein